MKIISVLIFFLFFSNCSFDNKTGIWKNSNELSKKRENELLDFKKIYTEQKLFSEIIFPRNNLQVKLDEIKENLTWNDEFYRGSNNLENFDYEDFNKIVFRSKKLTKFEVGKKILFDGENVILTDVKGNVFVYSIGLQEIVLKYNFYKKKFKKIKKSLHIKIEDNKIYVADNLGYLYSIDYKIKKLIWAKDFKIPFRSNVKIINDKLIFADTDNSLYLINKFNGEKIKSLPTEEALIKNEFINSLAIKENTLFYLNTFGSIYSINSNNNNINWFININPYSEVATNNLFNSKPLVLKEDKIYISTDKKLHIFDVSSGTRISEFPLSSTTTPIVSNKYLFLIIKQDILVCIDINEGNIVYSIDIKNEVAKYLNSKKKPIYIKTISILNNKLFIFLDNSYYIKFSSNGKLEGINKLQSKINSDPIFVNGKIIYINKKNRLVAIN
tara:strand:- start:8828 stop:10153 length:1326 start_codon:yes stop_codon:yes gene_type:complete